MAIPLSATGSGKDMDMFKSAAEGQEPDPVLRSASPGAAANVLSILQQAVGGRLPIRIRCWDGSVAGDPAAAVTIVFLRRRGLRRLLWAPNELGLVRAYVSGDMTFEGDIFALLDLPDVIERIAHHHGIGLTPRQRLAAGLTATRMGVVGPPPRPPAEEIRRQRGPLHSVARDTASVSHHYDVGNELYRLILGPSMVYSCAYWAKDAGPDYRLEQAQQDKCELVCTKLGLRPGMRLLDVGCGWGTLAIHAATHHGVSVVGVTLSQEQATLARERVEAAGMGDLVEIRLQDYRDVQDGPYDAISSVGMSEHVGGAQLRGYGHALMNLLAPGGRLLNHAIASVRSLPPASQDQPGFIDRYIFPDGEVVTLSTTLDALEQVGFEVRDVEALREHYGLTLRAWVNNLSDSWEEAQQLVSASRARTWLLYLAACALAFEHGNLTIHQVVAVRQEQGGASRFPTTRGQWLNTAP
jgi:cyclopropane-fatty-acyl-phospholipid synthase